MLDWETKSALRDPNAEESTGTSLHPTYIHTYIHALMHKSNIEGLAGIVEAVGIR